MCCQVASRLASCALEYVALYKQLQAAWSEKGSFFNITKKTHDLFHLGQRSNEVNPSMTSCMMQEDLMGRIKTLIVNCVKGAKPLVAVQKAMDKYRLALHIEHS